MPYCIRHARVFAVAILGALIHCGDDEVVTSPESISDPAAALAIGAAASPPLTFQEVSVGYGHTCGVTLDDRAYCWGLNNQGQLGDGTTTSHIRPVPVRDGHRFGIRAGSFQTCAIDLEDRAWCWGLNDEGQLGDGNEDSAA